MRSVFYGVKQVWEIYEANYSPTSYGQIVEQNGLFNLGMATDR